MIKKFILPLTLFLTACSSNTGYDGYAFGKPEYENKGVVVSVVTYKDRALLKKEAAKYNVHSDTLMAFSVISQQSNKICTIHMMDPSVKYEPEFIGHEFAHCLYGQWHTDNNSRS